MPTLDDPVAVYKELADWYDRRGEPPMRDRFLILAADAALRAGRPEDSDRLRLRLLKLNPHHLLKPYASFTQAMQAPDVQTYVRDLRLNYPPEVAQVLLGSLRTTGMKLDETQAPSSAVPTSDDDATVTLGEPMEPLRVFNDAAEPDSPQTAALPRHLLEQTQQPAPKPPPPPRPIPLPLPAAKKKSSPVPRPTPFVVSSPYVPVSETDNTSGGGWFAVALFVLVILSGLGLVGYLLARPFLS